MDFSEVSQIPPKTEDETNGGYATTREEIEQFAEEKLEEHGLDDWEFHWNSRMKRALGKCKFRSDKDRKKKIELSETWFIDIGMDLLIEEGQSIDFAEDTILHEIAHALDCEERGRSGHGFRWKQKARKVGADPTRVCDIPGNLDRLIATWKKVCPKCGTTKYYYKKPHGKRKKACAKCCEKHNNGKFSEEFIWEVRKHKPVI